MSEESLDDAVAALQVIAELRVINAHLGKINDRLGALERLMREIAVGLGIEVE